MKKTFLLGAIVLMGAALTACHDDDYSFFDPVAPQVTQLPNTLSGVIANKAGEPIEGATVTMGASTATTNANGEYEIVAFEAGNYTLEASANGYITATSVIEVPAVKQTLNLAWNVTLAKEVTADVNITVNEGGNGEVESEAIKDNENGKVNISVAADANVVPADTKISIRPVYKEEEAMAIRATSTESTMLIGAHLSCSDPNIVLSSPISIAFELDGSLADAIVTRHYANGRWNDVEHTNNNGVITIGATEFGAYGIFLDVVTNIQTSNRNLTLSPSEWDNLYGGWTIHATTTSYTHKSGTEITTQAQNKLEGLLIEAMAREFGSKCTERKGEHAVNMDVPAYTLLTVSGKQEEKNITKSANGTSVSAVNYGTVSVTVSATSRKHNGGGSAH